MNKVKLSFFVTSLILCFSTNAEDQTWNKEITESFVNGCVASIVEVARKGYFARAAEVGNLKPKPFPENELRDSFKSMCSCLADKLKSKNIAPDENSVNSPEFILLVQNAMLNGVCKPSGRIGDAISPKTTEKSKK